MHGGASTEGAIIGIDSAPQGYIYRRYLRINTDEKCCIALKCPRYDETLGELALQVTPRDTLNHREKDIGTIV